MTPAELGPDDEIYEDVEPEQSPYTWADEQSRRRPPSTRPGSSAGDLVPGEPGADRSGEETEEPIEEQVVPREGPVVEAESRPLTHHQQMQRRVATTSLVFVGFILAAGVIRWLIDPTVDLTSYTANLLAPIIGLVATIVGYFFGIASQEPKPRRPGRRKKRKRRNH